MGQISSGALAHTFVGCRCGGRGTGRRGGSVRRAGGVQQAGTPARTHASRSGHDGTKRPRYGGGGGGAEDTDFHGIDNELLRASRAAAPPRRHANTTAVTVYRTSLRCRCARTLLIPWNKRRSSAALALPRGQPASGVRNASVFLAHISVRRNTF